MKNIYLRKNVFYYRKSIPNHLKLFFQNKKLYIRTLSTKSKTFALKYAKVLNNKFNVIKEVYSMSFDINLIQQLVKDFHNTQLELVEKDLRNIPNPEDTTFALLLEDSIEQLQHNYQNNIFDIEEVQIILNKLNYKPNNKEIEQIGKILLDVKINNLKIINEKLNLDAYRQPIKVSFDNKTTIINENIKEVEEINTIATTFDKYIQYQSKQDNWSNDTLQLNIRTFKLLNMYFKDKNLKDITFDDLIDFRDTLLEVPLAYTTKNFFKDKDLEFIISNNDDYDTLSNDTVNRYIIRTNQYLDYMYKIDYITKKDFKIPKLSSNSKKRENYTNEEIQEISTLMENDTLENKFIARIATYQGMRLKEITQLRKEDIIKIDNIPCISINANENKTTKTAKSIRIIPIHPKLIELGFLDFVKSKKDNLFDIDNKGFSTYFRKTYKNQINENKTFYSLRHSFVNSLVQANQKLEHIQAFVGHSQSAKITFGYSNPVNVKLLKKLLRFINY
ncbi:site-specific integrase [Arcobacter porcinus]|uniref:site-specific integrase n=1 Tax=Arcobacter porcinus TaxID=1935204 RepID=UPI000826ED7C|nr:site-specific integrase [Arcobacter porcinus]OCL86171.1 site-specific tyrosine recombinase XerC [Arcobacter porcinus]